MNTQICNKFVNLIVGCLFLLVNLAAPNPSFSQEGPPIPPRIGFPIDSYKFIDTNWTTSLGYAPRSFFGMEGVDGWSTNVAVRIAGPGPAWLQYNVVENDGHTNISFPEGALSFWVRPLNWSSTNIEGGTGPGVPARLLELGAYSESGNWGWFSLILNEAGTTLSLGLQSNQFTAVPLQAPISWASNEVHMVALNYSLTNNMELYIDGQLTAITNGLPFWPGFGVLQTNGFFIGSDSSGSNIANADFEYLRFYDYPIPGYTFSAQYNRVLTNYLQEGFGPSMPYGPSSATETTSGSGAETLDAGGEGQPVLSISILDSNTVQLSTSPVKLLRYYEIKAATDVVGTFSSLGKFLATGTTGQWDLPNTNQSVFFRIFGPVDPPSGAPQIQIISPEEDAVLDGSEPIVIRANISAEQEANILTAVLFEGENQEYQMGPYPGTNFGMIEFTINPWTLCPGDHWISILASDDGGTNGEGRSAFSATRHFVLENNPVWFWDEWDLGRKRAPLRDFIVGTDFPLALGLQFDSPEDIGWLTIIATYDQGNSTNDIYYDAPIYPFFGTNVGTFELLCGNHGYPAAYYDISVTFEWGPYRFTNPEYGESGSQRKVISQRFKVQEKLTTNNAKNWVVGHYPFSDSAGNLDEKMVEIRDIIRNSGGRQVGPVSQDDLFPLNNQSQWNTFGNTMTNAGMRRLFIFSHMDPNKLGPTNGPGLTKDKILDLLGNEGPFEWINRTNRHPYDFVLAYGCYAGRPDATIIASILGIPAREGIDDDWFGFNGLYPRTALAYTGLKVARNATAVDIYAIGGCRDFMAKWHERNASGYRYTVQGAVDQATNPSGRSQNTTWARYQRIIGCKNKRAD